MIPYHKNKVKRVVWEKEKMSWKASIMMYKELNIYSRCVPDIKELAWWRYARKFPHIKNKVSSVVAVLLGSQPKGMQRNFKTKICQLCGIIESPKHILFECESLSRVRTQLWNNILHVMPTGMVNDINALGADDKTSFFLSGMWSYDFIQEWADIYHQIAIFIDAMYQERRKIYDEMG